MTAPALEARSVGHVFRGGVRALEGIDLAIGDGELVAILGRSGCGKTTLLRAMAGVIRPAEGTVLVRGAAVTGTAGHAAYMPQGGVLLPWRRALDNAVLGAQIAGEDVAAARQEAQAAFEAFGLAGFERAWPSTLSGGMRQRVALLRAFLADRPVVLLDEPLGALDALSRRDMWGWVERVWTERRHAVVLVTHDVDEAIHLADRVCVMSDRPGRIVHEALVTLPRPRADEVAMASLRAELLGALGQPS